MTEKCKLCKKPAIYISKKFISPLCQECAEQEIIRIRDSKGLKNVEVEDYYTEPCSEMNNVVKVFNQINVEG